MRKPMTMRFDPEILAKAKRQAALENCTLTNFIETAVRQRVAENLPATNAPSSRAGKRHPKAPSVEDRSR